jgi:hypothetical protein
MLTVEKIEPPYLEKNEVFKDIQTLTNRVVDQYHIEIEGWIATTIALELGATRFNRVLCLVKAGIKPLCFNISCVRDFQGVECYTLKIKSDGEWKSFTNSFKLVD